MILVRREKINTVEKLLEKTFTGNKNEKYLIIIESKIVQNRRKNI